MKLENKDFVHLHCHDEYSIMDALPKTEEYFKKAQELGFESFALTNHGHIGQWIRQLRTNRDLNFKSIFGCELYLNPKRDMVSQIREDIEKAKKEKQVGKLEGLIKEREKIRKNSHLTLLVKNDNGWKNLLKITNDSWVNGFYYKPRTDLKFIKDYTDDLICLSGCMSSRLGRLLILGKEDLALKLLNRYKDYFGDNFYIELILLEFEENIKINLKLYELAKKTNTKFVITNDVHYLNRNEAKILGYLKLMATTTAKQDGEVKHIKIKEERKLISKGLQDQKSDKYKSFGFSTNQLWFKTINELYRTYLLYYQAIPEKDFFKGIRESKRIFEKIEDYEPKFENELPLVTDSDYGDLELFKKKLMEGWRRLSKDKQENQIYKDRVKKEFYLIKKVKFITFFLILEDLMSFAKSKNIFVGPARGSSAGSLICYLLGINKVDPIRFGLYFERFISKDRREFPDVDLDFEPAGRSLVRNYLIKKWGEDKVIDIGTYGTYKTKILILDLTSKLFGLSRRDISSLLKFEKKYEIYEYVEDFEMLNWKQLSEASKEERRFNRIKDCHPDFLRAFNLIRGQIKNVSRHAAGLLINKTPLINNLAFTRSRDQIITAWTEGIRTEFTYLGYTKFDLLSINTLKVVKDCLNKIPYELNIDDISLNNKKIFKNIKQGDTLGIFQFESNLMRRLLRDSRCSSFNELIAIIALGRPQPLSFGLPKVFCRRKIDGEKYRVPEFIKNILEPTYGIIIFQEQVLEIFNKVIGIDIGEADTFKKLFIKRRRYKEGDRLHKEFERFKQKFFKKGEEKMSKKEVESIWDSMSHLVSYLFNKSHAVSYAILSLWCAYLKTFYPLEYMLSLLRNENIEEKIQLYIRECKRLGIKVLKPHINKSKVNFNLEDDNIRIGLKKIKNVGLKAAINIMKNQPFKDEEDFFNKVTKRIVNKRVVEALKNANAFKF